MGIGFSSSHLLEPELYRDIPEVVERGRLFESYSEWTTDDVQKAVQRFADSHEAKRAEKVGVMQAELDAKRAEMEKLRPTRKEKRKKKKGLFGKRQEEEIGADLPPFDPVYDRIEKEFAGLQAQHDEMVALTVDNSAVMAKVGWQELYSVLADTEERRLRTLRERERKAFSPIATGYTMEQDPEAQALLDAYNRGQVERPGLEDYEIDGHTDDSASETEDDSDVESGSGTEEEEDEEDAEQSDETDEFASKNSASGSSSGSGSEEEGSEEDSEEEAARLAAAMESYESGDEEENELRRAKMVDRPLPDIFNPALCSPIFFGYTTRTVAAEVAEYEEHKAKEAVKEAAFAVRQKRAVAEAKAKGKKEDEDRRAAYAKRGDSIKKTREKARLKREADRRHAEKMLSPDDEFFDKWEETEKEEKKKAKEEDRAYAAQEATMEALITEKQEAREKATSVAGEAENLDRPRGPMLMQQAQQELARVVQLLNTARGKLEESERMLRLASQEVEADDKGGRAVLLQAEDEVNRAERDVTAQLDELETCEALLERAIEVQEKEGRFLPLWDYLVSPVSYTVRLGELLFALSVGCGKALLVERMRFNFKWFDVDNSRELGKSKLSAFVLTTVGVLEKLGDIRRMFLLSQDEIDAIVHRAFRVSDLAEGGELVVGGPPLEAEGLAFFEFQQWLLHVVGKNRRLARMFDVPWRYCEMSRIQRQDMGFVHQFEIGMINIVDLKYRTSRELTRYRPCLNPDRKEEVHELAMAMGQDDPIKPDYTKFLPKKKGRGWSNVVPLEHGHLHNLTVWRRQYVYDCAAKIASVYRGHLGRIKADSVAKKNAFYHAKLLMLLEVREKVCEAWRRKDAQKGVAKMKWDAKIRMKQVSLRANGFNLDRDETFQHMMKEAVRDAQDNEVENKFAEMEKERGYPGFHAPGGLDNVSGLILKQICEARFEEWKPSMRREAVHKQQGLTEEGDAAPGAGPEVDDEDGSSQHLSGASGSHQSRNQSSGSSSGGTLVTKSSDSYSASYSTSGPSDRSDATTVVVSEEQPPAPPLGHTEELSKMRKDNMIVGKFPPELYRTGETEAESTLREQLAVPHPDHEVLVARLTRLSNTFTPLKTFEMLLELPSKRLLCEFVQKFPTKDELLEEIYAHFRVTRDTEAVAEVLMDWTKSDLEAGFMRDMALRLVEVQEASLHQIAQRRHDKDAGEAEEEALKRARAAAMRMADLTEEAMADELENKRQEEMRRRKKAVADARAQIVKHTANLVRAEQTLTECERKQVRREDKVVTHPTERRMWMARFIQANQLSEDDEAQMALKILELRNVMGDFLATAQRNAVQIISELGLDVKDKTIKPVKIDESDRRLPRFKYIQDNIYFKVCTDDHGIFNGSDEMSAKSFGCEITGSLEYLKCGIPGLHVPLQTVVDVFGFRVFCCAVMPIQRFVFNQKGEIKKTVEEHVYGTTDRGIKIKSTSRLLEQKLTAAARKMNLARHGVKGEKDLTVRYIPAAGDMKGYKAEDGHSFYMLNFRRALPMEDPEATSHLPRSERGQSIFCRQLRPELVREYKVPLSADANCKISKDGPDWEEHVTNAREAAHHMVHTVLPQLAEDICKRPVKAEGELPSVENLDLTEELHRRGIGMRHLGLLRTKFWVKLTGPAELQYSNSCFMSKEGGVDFREEVGRGWQVRLGPSKQLARVSKKESDRFDRTYITLDKGYKGPSTKFGVVWTGAVSDMENSAAVRLKITGEMVARATKQLLRFYMRHIVKETGVAFINTQKFLIVEFLNMLTGAHQEAEQFWGNQLFLAIRYRFGMRAIATTERPNLRLTMEPVMPYVVTRLSAMLGFQLNRDCLQRFERHHEDWKGSRLFRFTMSDFVPDSSFVRSKHNMCHLEYYKASQLLMQAKMSQATTYSRAVLMDQPVGYWRLTERIGSKIAKNLGIGGVGIAGFYRSVVFEAPGPVKNDDLDRSTRFSAQASHPSVDVRYHPDLAPANPEQAFSVECWARATGQSGSLRVCVMTGRFALAATKKNEWAFVVYGEGTEVIVMGPPVVEMKWTSLLGTYDGTVMRFYVDGVLVGGFEVGPALAKKLAEDRAASQARWSALEVAELNARDKGRANASDEANRYFRTDDGAADLKERARKLQEQVDFRLKTNKRAKEQGLKRLGRKEATTQATAMFTQKMLDDALKVISEDFQQKRGALKDAEDKASDERALLATRDLKIGGACASKRAKYGRSHWVGDLAHIATYLSSISHDGANRHYRAGTEERALQSDREYGLAYSHFRRAMWWAPEDPQVLHKFADTICGALRYDSDHIQHFDAYKRKVAMGVAMFKRLGNSRGICEVCIALLLDLSRLCALPPAAGCKTHRACRHPLHFLLLRSCAACPRKSSTATCAARRSKRCLIWSRTSSATGRTCRSQNSGACTRSSSWWGREPSRSRWQRQRRWAR